MYTIILDWYIIIILLIDANNNQSTKLVLSRAQELSEAEVGSSVKQDNISCDKLKT